MRGAARRLAGVVALAVAVVAPAGATASVADVNGSQLVYAAAAGEANNATIALSGGAFIVTDPGAPITPMAPECVAVNANQAACIAAGVDQFQVDVGDLDDSFAIDPGVVVRESFSFAVLIQGGAGNDTLTGSAQLNNIIYGDSSAGTGNGNDTLNGGSLNDSMIGGDGNDVLNGGDGQDQFSAGDAADGADVFNGGRDLDFLSYDNRFGNVRVDLDGFADDGEGCPGPGCENDNAGADVEGVSTGFGDDVVIGGSGPDDIFTSFGNDMVIGGPGPDDIFASRGDDVVRGGPGADLLTGAEGSDRVQGEAGDDTFFSAFNDDEPDVYSGGEGADLADYSDANSAVKVDLDNKADDGVEGENDNVKPDVEDILGSDGADVLIGSKKDNDLVGGEGNDRLVGQAGLDALLGDEGNDLLLPGAGRDLVEGDSGADNIRSRDKSPDEVLCGSAVDSVKADRRDRTAADCDKVTRR